MTENRDNILSGIWSRGFQLSGELDLTRRRGVSVITVRQALAQLAPEGPVRRERAKGSFVNWSGPVNQAINLEIETETLVTLNPEGTSFKLLDSGMNEPGTALQREFELPAKERITRMTVVRMAQGAHSPMFTFMSLPESPVTFRRGACSNCRSSAPSSPDWGSKSPM